MILTIKTDQPEAELALFTGETRVTELKWEAHRKLAETIHTQINQILNGQKLSLKDIEGIVCFKGPGSFTGLRIGLSVGNALAYGLDVPVVSKIGDDWQTEGIACIINGENEVSAIPEYGAEPHITKPRK
ncbi:MAG: tRNA (adenosine(37)-N6)-threonylcarbamoyltransferase complex dimerization subunit type 1 TsaB [Candidatus Saccharibacteria bacterium]